MTDAELIERMIAHCNATNVAALRTRLALPVIATCGGCPCVARDPRCAVQDPDGTIRFAPQGPVYCDHLAAPRHCEVDPDAAPPSWCPMRGGR